jgi:anti-sigma-K factor RskA
VTPGEPRPRRAPDHAGFEELAVGYALHALEPDEELRFTAHLSSCNDCAGAVAEHERTLAELALSLPQEEPPAAVLQALRSATAQVPAAVRTLREGVVPLAAARSRRAPKVAQVRRSWLLSGAAAVTAAVLGLGLWGAGLQGDLDAETTRADALAAVVETLETPGARTVQLADGDGTVRLVAVGGSDRLRLAVDGLTPNAEDTTYVLWGRTDAGEVVALGAFDVPTEELTVQEVGLARPLDQLDALMVTHERGRTVPPSTDQPVLVLGRI